MPKKQQQKPLRFANDFSHSNMEKCNFRRKKTVRSRINWRRWLFDWGCGSFEVIHFEWMRTWHTWVSCMDAAILKIRCFFYFFNNWPELFRNWTERCWIMSFPQHFLAILFAFVLVQVFFSSYLLKTCFQVWQFRPWRSTEAKKIWFNHEFRRIKLDNNRAEIGDFRIVTTLI